MIEIKLSEFTNEEKIMREKAIEACNKVHEKRFLKSTTKVGTCIKTESDSYYTGINFDFEFGKVCHSEESAIINMMNNSIFDNDLIYSVYIYCERECFTSCGDCRDKMRLFCADPSMTRIYVDNGTIIKAYDLDELIPHYPIRGKKEKIDISL